MSQSLVESKISPVGRSGKDIIYVCPNPRCDDTTGHMYVNYDKGYYNCFKCSFGGKSISSLMKKLGMKSDFDYEELQTDYESELDSILELPKKQIIGGKKIVEYKREFSYDVAVTTEWFNRHSMPLTQPAYDYLIGRGMTPQQIVFYGMREGVNLHRQPLQIKGTMYIGKNYSGRILIPSIIPGVGISMFVARDYLGWQVPKYLNPPKEIAYASEDVWNLNQVNSRVVIVNEGVLTAITAGGAKYNATATYGKSIADVSNAEGVPVKSQGEKLLDKNFDIYYMSYDSDATRESLENAQYLHERGAKVKVVYIDPNVYGPKADANSIGYAEYLKCLATAHDFDNFLKVFLN